MKPELCLAGLMLVASFAGCSDGPIVGGQPKVEQSAAYEMLSAMGASVSMDEEGNIVSVQVEDELLGDDAVALLVDIPTLKSVGLAGTAVTDEGLAQLEKMTTLESIDLEDTKVSRAAVNKLRAALPNCRIAHGGDNE